MMAGRVLREVRTMRSIWRNEEGSALLEAVAIVPVLIVLVGGTLEFSEYFERQHRVSTGVRDAARYLARTDPADATAQAIAKNIAARGSADTSLPLRVPGFDPTVVVTCCTPPSPPAIQVCLDSVPNPQDLDTLTRPYRETATECGGPDNVLIIKVTGRYSHPSIGLLGYLTDGVTLKLTHFERCIGPS
jgi:hypothetical protein